MYGFGFSGKGFGGRGKGYGRTSFRPPVEKAISMDIPDGAAGLIIGSKGSNIKELQNISGVQYVELRNERLDIGGCSTAVEEVQMRVQAKINEFRTKSRNNKTTHVHIDTEGAKFLRFSAARGHDVPADFSSFRVDREYFVLDAVSELDGLTARLNALDIGRQGKSPAECLCGLHVPRDLEKMRKSFREILDGLSSVRADKVDVQMRFGVLGFHLLGRNADDILDQQSLRQLVPHEDFKMQFSPHLRPPLDELEAILLREGFECMEKACCSVVHLVNLTAGEAYAAVFVEAVGENDGDPRTDDAKRTELLRISQCRSPQEVLEVVAGATRAAIKKAYLKKSLMVHPDKNAFAGATEAMKVLGSALETLEAGRSTSLRPPLFEVGASDKDLPKLIKLQTARAMHLQEDTVRLHGKLGYRAFVSSQSDTYNPAARTFMEQQWKNGAIVAGRTLTGDARYSIDSVRFKEKTCYSNGSFVVELEHVRQKSLSSAGSFQTRPEMSLRSEPLEQAVAFLQANPADAMGKQRAIELYMAMVAAAQGLATRIV
eukprot:TRINITY_DN59219_c0_g1_i1.p1 TRINITY_DN59219_c0_g1~~TRINITY_DN59219_c0_g1_i1.p1  ORF type:complete len:545 (+),score=105.97 TRINITY_DN59219_c0_g1_i1:184-1818(+)